MIKALICLSLATIAGAFSAQAPTKPIQTTDLVSVVSFSSMMVMEHKNVGCCVRFALRCGGIVKMQNA